MFQLEPHLGALALSLKGEPELDMMGGRKGQGKLSKMVIEK